MKVRRKLALGVAVVVAAIALSIAPASAFAEVEGPGGPHASMASAGGNVPCSVLAAANAGFVQDDAPEAVDAIGGEQSAEGPGAGVDEQGAEAPKASSGEEGLAPAAGGAQAIAPGEGQSPQMMAAGEGEAAAQQSAMAVNGPKAAIDALKTAEGDQLSVQSEGELEIGPWGPLEIAVAKNLIEGAICGVASGTFSWSAQSILKTILGDSVDDQTQAKLDEILQDIDRLNTAMGELQKTANSQQLDNILNSLTPVLSKLTTHNVLDSIAGLDKSAADDKKRRIQSELTTSLGNGNVDDIGSLASVEGSYDNYTKSLWDALTGTWHVTIDGQPRDLTTMQIWYEHLRYTYPWEHQAYSEWAGFQGQCVSLLASSLALERASLQVRLEMIEDHNKKCDPSKRVDEGAVKSRLYDIQDYINQMAGFTGYVTVETGEVPGMGLVQKYVDYPGLFSEMTWSNQYWMYKERPDYRYYWAPGHEVLFYAQVNTQNVPQETKNYGLTSPSRLKGVNVDWFDGETFIGNGYDVWPKNNFWKPFVTYQNGLAPLASKDQLRTIYKDYKDLYKDRGGEKHLYTIFIDPDEGNFLGLDEKNIHTWWFVLDGGVDYEQHEYKADELSCKVMLSSDPSTVERAILCYYHRGSTEPSSQHHYIGVGVARVGPETYNPINNALVVQAKPEVLSRVSYSGEKAHWNPSHGDLFLSFDGDAHGGVGRVLMDGQELDASCYEMKDGTIVLAQAYLANLGYGEHELFLDTEGGSHTIVFTTASDSAEPAVSDGGSIQRTAATPVSAMPKTGDAFALLATMFMIAAMLSACVAVYARPRAKRGGRQD